MRDTRDKLSGTTVVLHWLIAAAIIGNPAFGFIIGGMPRGDAKGRNIGLQLLFSALGLSPKNDGAAPID